MRDELRAQIQRVEEEIGPHPDLSAFVTVHGAVRAAAGSDAARGSAPVTLYSDEGHQYAVGFDALLDGLLTLAARDVAQSLTDEALG